MTVLADFLDGISEENRQRAPSDWASLVRLFELIDGAQDPEIVELRKAMEKVIHQDLPLRDRSHALIPLLRPHLPKGGTLH